MLDFKEYLNSGSFSVHFTPFSFLSGSEVMRCWSISGHETSLLFPYSHVFPSLEIHEGPITEFTRARRFLVPEGIFRSSHVVCVFFGGSRVYVGPAEAEESCEDSPPLPGCRHTRYQTSSILLPSLRQRSEITYTRVSPHKPTASERQALRFCSWL